MNELYGYGMKYYKFIYQLACDNVLFCYLVPLFIFIYCYIGIKFFNLLFYLSSIIQTSSSLHEGFHLKLIGYLTFNIYINWVVWFRQLLIINGIYVTALSHIKPAEAQQSIGLHHPFIRITCRALYLLHITLLINDIHRSFMFLIALTKIRVIFYKYNPFQWETVIEDQSIIWCLKKQKLKSKSCTC